MKVVETIQYCEICNTVGSELYGIFFKFFQNKFKTFPPRGALPLNIDLSEKYVLC